MRRQPDDKTMESKTPNMLPWCEVALMMAILLPLIIIVVVVNLAKFMPFHRGVNFSGFGVLEFLLLGVLVFGLVPAVVTFPAAIILIGLLHTTLFDEKSCNASDMASINALRSSLSLTCWSVMQSIYFSEPPKCLLGV